MPCLPKQSKSSRPIYIRPPGTEKLLVWPSHRPFGKETPERAQLHLPYFARCGREGKRREPQECGDIMLHHYLSQNGIIVSYPFCPQKWYGLMAIHSIGIARRIFIQLVWPHGIGLQKEKVTFCCSSCAVLCCSSCLEISNC